MKNDAWDYYRMFCVFFTTTMILHEILALVFNRTYWINW